MTSKVISFRLDDVDPDEAAALAWLEAWRQQDKEPRQMIVRAVLMLAAQQDTSQSRQSLVDQLQAALAERDSQLADFARNLEADNEALAGQLREALVDVRRLAETIQHGPAAAASQPQLDDDGKLPVSEDLLAAVARNVKRSKRLE